MTPAGLVLAVLTAASARAPVKLAMAADAGSPNVDMAQSGIEHTPLERSPRNEAVSIQAKIGDPSRLFAPLVFARKAGTSRYEAYTMKDRGPRRGFQAKLPASILSEGSFEYFIEAQHEEGNPTRAGSPKKPFTCVVYDPPLQPVAYTFRTAAPGARIRVDDNDVGVTPLTVPLYPGPHSVLVTTPDGRSAEQQIEVRQGQQKSELAFDLPGDAAAPGTLSIQSEPPGANVLIDGVLSGRTPYRGEWAPGEHLVSVEMEGRLRERRRVVARTGLAQAFTFTLAAAPRGQALSVESDPPGATVLIDGKQRGRTPLIAPVSAGGHQLVLRLEGRRDVATDFNMPGDRDYSLRLELPLAARGASRLTVSSMPAGASVVIDGSEVGVTPWSGNAKTGAHEVAVTSIGYLKDSRTVQIQANRDMELAFALNRAPGPARLNIETEPAGVPVLLDGTNLGTTPFHSDVQAGEHQLELTLAGYRTIAQPIAVDSGQGLSLRYLLQPARTHEAPLLSVSSEPAGAQIWLDGKPAGVTPSKLRTAPGAHEVKLTLDGYVPRVAHPNIPPDREFELRIAAILRPVRGAEQQQHAPTDTELFQAQVERAHTCYVKGDLDCALASYRSAYAYKQDPRVLFNIAQTRRKLGQMPEAASSYRQFLSQTDKKKSKVAKKDIIDEAKRQLAFCENRMLPSLADVPATPAPPEDNTPPRVTHAALRSAMRGKPVRLAAEVTDDRSGVSSVQVCWRNGFHRDFECHAMDNEEADRYGLEIPARAVTDGFAYYLEAYDNANNGPARNGAPDLPHAVLIEDATPVPPAAAAVAEAMPPLPAGGAVPAGYNASTPPRGNPAGVSPRNDADKPGPWNLTVRLGGERSAESSYTDSVLLGRLGVDGSRFFGDWFANATADWRNYRQTYVQQSPTSPRVAVDENRLDFAGRAGYDAGARLLSSGKLELIPYATLSYVRAWNTGYSFDLFGPGAGLRAGYTIAPFAIRGAFDYTYNVLSGTGSSSAFLSPVSSMSWRFGVEVQLSRAYAIELDYVGDTVQFDQVWRVAQGALFGFSTSF